MKILSAVSAAVIILFITTFESSAQPPKTWAWLHFPTVTQQSKERTIKRLSPDKNEPLAITEMKVNGQVVFFDQKFMADDDWMKSLVISVKNTSDKHILFANLDLWFLRPPGSEPPVATSEMVYGNYLLRSRPPTPSESLAGLAPNQVADFQFNINEFQGLQRLLKDATLPMGIEKFSLRLGQIIFEDDSMWYIGTQFRRDKDLTSWRQVNYRKTEQP